MKPIVYNNLTNQQLATKMTAADFSSQSWSDDDLVNIKKFIKEHYLNEQLTTCPYCKRNLQTKHGRSWDIEHIISRSSAVLFMFEPLNLCMSCVDCNSAKSDKPVTRSKAKSRYPTRSDLFFIVHPHFDNYEEFLIPLKPGFFYISLSEKGSKTIEICNLNRFYETAGFGANDANDEEIFLLSDAIQKADNEQTKINLRRRLAVLAIQGSK